MVSRTGAIEGDSSEINWPVGNSSVAKANTPSDDPNLGDESSSSFLSTTSLWAIMICTYVSPRHFVVPDPAPVVVPANAHELFAKLDHSEQAMIADEIAKLETIP